MFPCRASFSGVLDKIFTEVSVLVPQTYIPLALKNFWLRTGTQVSFWKILHVWQRSEYVCLNNCSVICTVNLCYVLQEIHSEFSHIQYSVFSGERRHIQSYSKLLKHIQAYWDFIKAYLGSPRHIQHTV